MMTNVVLPVETITCTNLLGRKKKKKKKRGNQNNVLPEQLGTDNNSNNKNKGIKRRNMPDDNNYDINTCNVSRNLKLADTGKNNSCIYKNNHVSKRCSDVNTAHDCDFSSTLKKKKKKESNNDAEKNCSCILNNESICDCTDVKKRNNFNIINVDIDYGINSSNTSNKKRKKKKKRKKEKHSNANKGVPYDAIDSTDENLNIEDGSSVPISLDSSGQESNKTQVDQDGFSQLHYITGGNRTNIRLEILKNKGIVPNKGRWTSSEVGKLHENMMDFLVSHEVKDFRRLVMPMTMEDKLFRKQTQFVYKMCRGIPRTGRDINKKVLVQYAHFLKKGKFSAEEKEKLIQLQKIYGNKWKQIGFLMNRYYTSLQNKYTYISKQWNKGLWTKEEDKLLTKSVNTFLEKGEQISWGNVSKFVGTRTPVSCLTRWGKYLRHNYQIDEDIVFNEEDVYKLVSTIYESNIDDEYLIDWNELATHFMGRVKPSWLKYKFGAICKEVAHYHKLEFVDLLDQLYDIYHEKKNAGEQGECN